MTTRHKINVATQTSSRDLFLFLSGTRKLSIDKALSVLNSLPLPLNSLPLRITVIMNRIPRGLGSRPSDPGEWAYSLTQPILSLDEDGTMRCGRMDIFFPGSHPVLWSGLTVAQVFKKSWNPESFDSPFDPEEPISGKGVYMAEWQGPERADITNDRYIVRPGPLIGTVLLQEGLMAYVKVTESFVRTPKFQNEGMWVKMGRMPPTTTEQAPKREESKEPRTKPFTKNEMFTEEVFQRYPKADIEQLKYLIRTHMPSDLPMPTDRDLIKTRVQCRLENPICEREGCTSDKKKVKRYFLCACCKIVMYCSPECCVAAADKHRVWARNLPHSAPPAYNPMVPALLERDPVTGEIKAKYTFDSDGKPVTV